MPQLPRLIDQVPPAAAIVLGALLASADPAPLPTPTAAANVFGWVSDSGHLRQLGAPQ